MHKPQKQRYLPPRVSQTVSLRLERSLLNSVVENTQPVETAGQEIDDVLNAADSYTSTSTFNYDWGDGT